MTGLEVSAGLAPPGGSEGVWPVPLSRLLVAPVTWLHYPMSASIFTWTTSLCLCMSVSLFMRTPVIGLGTHPSPVGPHVS